MDWAKPKYSREEVNWAGKIVTRDFADLDSMVDDAQSTHAFEIMDNFRATHAYPLNILQHRLRVLASDIDSEVIIAQRLKRFISIIGKLQRFPNMKLWSMQDIGGCRAILQNLADVNRLVEAMKASNIKHKLWHEDDYIFTPSLSGYRSRHLMYRYYSDKVNTSVYNDLRIEVQIRTSMQHAWATTVETVGTFTKQALKSSQGDEDWKRFFQLMGTWMALREGTPVVPGTPNDRSELKKELKACAGELQVEKKLFGFTTAVKFPTQFRKRDDSDYYLMSLDNNKGKLSIRGYKLNELGNAVSMYDRVERRIRKGQITDAVLVSVSTVNDLRRAYPNYYADTYDFVEELKRAIK